jgi:hypothetical protein
MPTTAGLVVAAACNLVATALLCGANWHTPNGRCVRAGSASEDPGETGCLKFDLVADVMAELEGGSMRRERRHNGSDHSPLSDPRDAVQRHPHHHDHPHVLRRNPLINAHLARLESKLERTTWAVESLRHLLEPGSAAVESEIRYRRVEAIEAIAISEVIDMRDALTWHQGALAELNATISAQGVRICGPVRRHLRHRAIRRRTRTSNYRPPHSGCPR